MLALEAIYGAEDFSRDADGRGFSLRVAAHEGAAMALAAEEASVSLSLSGDGGSSSSAAAAAALAAAATRARKKAAAREEKASTPANNTSAALLCVRYPALYPSRPLKVTVKPLEGLPDAAARALQNQLSALAAEAAEKGSEPQAAAEKAAAE